MGYYGKLELKQKAQKLRKRGRSYQEITRLLNVPKSTISDWCKDIILSDKQIFRLYKNKLTGALKGSAIASQKKILTRLKSTELLFKQGLQEVGQLSKRDKFIAGIAYYSSEGTKTDKGCAFANADPKIICFMINWFREFGGLPVNKFHGAIWIHKNQGEQAALNYWSSLTSIPKTNFYKSYIVENKNKSKKIRKQIHPYGIFSLYVSNVALQRKIMGWIGGVLQKPMI